MYNVVEWDMGNLQPEFITQHQETLGTKLQEISEFDQSHLSWEGTENGIRLKVIGKATKKIRGKEKSEIWMVHTLTNINLFPSMSVCDTLNIVKAWL